MTLSASERSPQEDLETEPREGSSKPVAADFNGEMAALAEEIANAESEVGHLSLFSKLNSNQYTVVAPNPFFFGTQDRKGCRCPPHRRQVGSSSQDRRKRAKKSSHTHSHGHFRIPNLPHMHV